MLIENIFDEKQCLKIADAMELLCITDDLKKEDNVFYKNSLGFFNLPETLEELLYVEKLVKEKTGYDNIEFENAYTRIYRNGSILGIHTDRPGLDLSLSISIFSNTNKSWPIYISEIRVDEGTEWKDNQDHADIFKMVKTGYDIPIGSGLLMHGTQFPHWREELICEPDEYVIQTFYHWRFD